MELVRDRDVADDLCQEFFVTVAEKPPEHGDAPLAWARKVMGGLASHHWRSENRRHKYELKAAEKAFSASDLPEEHLEQIETHEGILAGLRQLGDPYRTVIWMSLAQGKSDRQIAAALDKPYNTIRTQRDRGIAKLREQLSQDFPNWKVRCALLIGLSPLRPDVLQSMLQPSAGSLGSLSVAKAAMLATGVLVLAVAGIVIASGSSDPAQGTAAAPGASLSTGVQAQPLSPVTEPKEASSLDSRREISPLGAQFASASTEAPEQVVFVSVVTPDDKPLASELDRSLHFDELFTVAFSRESTLDFSSGTPSGRRVSALGTGTFVHARDFRKAPLHLSEGTRAHLSAVVDRCDGAVIFKRTGDSGFITSAYGMMDLDTRAWGPDVDFIQIEIAPARFLDRLATLPVHAVEIETGEPAIDAHVGVIYQDRLFSARTDAEGHAVLLLPPGRHKVEVSDAQGYTARHLVELAESARPEPLLIELGESPGRQIYGHVLTAAGMPSRGDAVFLFRIDSLQRPLDLATPESGSFVREDGGFLTRFLHAERCLVLPKLNSRYALDGAFSDPAFESTNRIEFKRVVGEVHDFELTWPATSARTITIWELGRDEIPVYSRGHKGGTKASFHLKKDRRYRVEVVDDSVQSTAIPVSTSDGTGPRRTHTLTAP